MKRVIRKCIVLLLLFVAPALFGIAEELTISDGKITGTVTALFGKGTGQETLQAMLVDCAVPQAAYTDEIFEIEFRHFNKEDMQRALRAAGQSDQGTFVHSASETLYTNTAAIDPSAPLSREEAIAQATQTGIRYFEALGIDVVETPVIVERPYDLDAFMEGEAQRYAHMYSDIQPFMERAQTQWVRTHRYETRSAAYTRVTFAVMVEGMRCFTQPSYPAGYCDEPGARVGFEVSACVLVSDSGVLVEASTSHIPQIKARRQLSADEAGQYAALLSQTGSSSLIRSESWQAALSAALQDASHIGGLFAGTEDHLYQNQQMASPVTAYGYQAVITEIVPCLSAITQNEWAMFWVIDAQRQYADGYRY